MNSYNKYSTLVTKNVEKIDLKWFRLKLNFILHMAVSEDQDIVVNLTVNG